MACSSTRAGRCTKKKHMSENKREMEGRSAVFLGGEKKGRNVGKLPEKNG